MTLDLRHVVAVVVLAAAALGVFFWNRTCILSAEISDMSAKLNELATMSESLPSCGYYEREDVKDVNDVKPPKPPSPNPSPPVTTTDGPTEKSINLP